MAEHAAMLKRATAESYLDIIMKALGGTKPKVLEAGSGSGDFLLAAQARVRNLIIVTRNVKNFRDRDVSILDPFAAGTS